MSLRAFIQHNFWLKLFSLILATLIWFAINFGIKNDLHLPKNPLTNPTTREFLRLPVRVLLRAGDDRIFQVSPEDVVVAVTGEAAILRDLSLRNITAYVDLATALASRETNQQIRIDLPIGVTLINIEPRAVNIEEIKP